MFDHMIRRLAEQRRSAIRERLSAHAALPARMPGRKAPTATDGRSLILFYNLRTGHWSGDDSPGDSNGYGHASGDEDLIPWWNDCAIWFDIWQNDYDGDGLTWWRECGPDNPNRYGTDPTEWDTDGDGLSDYDEIIVYGINPLDSDIDDDGILDGVDLFMPTEWGLKDELIISWPLIYDSLQPMYKQIIKESLPSLGKTGKVTINIVDQAYEQEVRNYLTAEPNPIPIEAFDNKIQFFPIESGTGLWVRDYGPQFVLNKINNKIVVVDWNYGVSVHNSYPRDYYEKYTKILNLDYICFL